jgi:uncharacterized damage-inducible protein DinB
MHNGKNGNWYSEVLATELIRESEATRRVLERVPEDRLSWKPHARSMSLGQLALHVAGVPGGVARLLDQAESAPPVVPLTEAGSRAEVLEALEESVATAADRLRAWGDEGLKEEWRMIANGQVVLAMHRVDMVRSILLNHWYHHRGQLLVYLRLLDVPLPPVYGPTADEDPFG